MKRNVSVMAIMVLLCGQLLAAVPTMINYQGRLTDAGGNPVADGNYSIVFRIYDAASGGTSKWTETQSVSTAGGFFAVLLGTLSPLTDTIFTSATRYLSVKVGTDPELTPRTRLLTVPFADRVSTVDGSSGGSISGNLNLNNSTATTGNILKEGVSFIQNFGTSNTAIGLNAGNLTMSGTENTMTGRNALHSNTSGNWNTSTGFNALSSNTVGHGNTANGHNALLNNTTGRYNAAFGKDALYSSTVGDSNTACGFQALFYNTDGTCNSAFGFQALLFNTADYNTADGYLALLNNTTGFQNTASGWAALRNNVAGTGNTAYGANALAANVNGGGNTGIGIYADVSTGGLFNATAIGSGAVVDASNKIRLGNSAVTVIQGQVAYTFTSDRNQKENFLPVDGEAVLQKIRSLSLSSWNYKNNDPKQFRHYGPVAQDFFAAFGHDSVGTCGDSVSINSGDMAGITLIAVQTLETDREQLRARVETIQAENTELKARLEKLEATMNKIVHHKL